MNETLRHRQAFDYYYGLGDKRSYSQVAEKLHVSDTSIAKWSKAHDWGSRVEQRDIENARRIEKKTDDTIVNTKARYRKIIKALIAKAVDKIKKGELDPETIQDVERLAKLDLLLMGEATERTESKEYIAEWGDSETEG